MNITNVYTKGRATLGKQPMFSERGPELCDTIVSDKDVQRQYVLRNPVHEGAQTEIPKSAHPMNTFSVELSFGKANHAEGGFPRDVNYADPEAVQRYRRREEKEDGYVNAVLRLNPDLERCIDMNNSMELYQLYFDELEPQPLQQKTSIRTMSVYRGWSFPESEGVPVSSLSWNNEGNKMVVAHAYTNYSLDFDTMASCGHVWDVENCAFALLEIEGPSEIFCLEYSSKEINSIIGGMRSGRVVVYDIRNGGAPVGISAPHSKHREAVTGVLFINSKTNTEFFSGSTDGMVKWWDSRNLKDPIDTMIIDPLKTPFDEQNQTKALGVSCLEFETTIATKFMVGTDQGFVICGNRKGKTPTEKLTAKYMAHNGSVYRVQRNRQIQKIFLTIGDWTARIFSEDNKEDNILWTYPHRKKMADGVWSPTRFSMFMTVMADGSLACWDLLKRHSSPVAINQFCKEPLTKMEAHIEGKLVLCGSQSGAVFLGELADGLCDSSAREKQLLAALFERESKREKQVESRLREVRMIRAAAAGEHEPPPPPDHPSEVFELVTENDNDLKKAESEFWKIIEKESGKKIQKKPKPENEEGDVEVLQELLADYPKDETEVEAPIDESRATEVPPEDRPYDSYP